MSLLRALRAYVGLGPDDEYDEFGPDRRNRTAASAAGRTGRSERPVRTRRGGYLDDLERRADDESVDLDVVDITTAKIEARRADGTVDRQGRSTANHSRVRAGRGSERQQRLVQNRRLLEELRSDPLDELEVDLAESEPFDEPPTTDAATQAEGAVVRSIESARSRPRTLTPESFADAKEVGDEFKRGTPVVVNLQGLDRDLVRRLVDFASGICYALDGSMEKLAPQVFLLTPEGLDVSDDDRRRIEQRGYAR
ncbi:MAG: cell division protein SepF [Acidimicrobiia bacterium]|nr:cell division protein SepF [Acidimicrobiia bacterium]